MAETRYIKTRTASGAEAWVAEATVVSGSMVYPGAGIALSTGAAWGTSVANNSANWNTAYSDRLKWDGGATDLVAATGRTSLGATTAGAALFMLANPSAITFIRINADNTVSALSAADFKTALSLGNVTNESKATMFTDPTFTGTVNATTIHGTTLLIDHVGEHTGSHTVVFDNTVTLPASTLVPDGGSIGQAAGPLMTFDDSNNYLEITGCNIGINTTAPVARLHIAGDSGVPAGLISDTYILLSNNSAAGDNAYFNIQAGTAGIAGITFGDSNDDDVAYIKFNNNGNLLQLQNTGNLITMISTGAVGFGTIAPNAKIESLATTEQLRLSYDATHYTSFTVAAAGNLTIAPVDGLLYITGAAAHTSFAPNWTGNNWQITATGDATFENLFVRAAARFRELIIDQLSIVAGSNLMSIARGKIASINTGDSKVTLDDPNARGACAFAANDFFWIKAVDIDKNLFSDIRGQITNVTGLVLTLSFAVAGANGAIGDISVGDVIVQRGNSATAGRQNLIYTTVSDSDAPYERIMTGVDSLAAFTDLDNVVYQHGDLTNLASHGIVPATPGFGVYTNNGYFSGTIVSISGTIGGWTLAATTITGGDVTLDSTGVLTLGTGDDVAVMSAVDGTYRLWIGDATAADAEFSVTKAGALKATSGTVGGFSLSATQIYYGSGASRVELNSGGFMCGGETTASASFVADQLGRVKVGTLIYAYALSNDILISHDASAETAATSYTKVKTIIMGSYLIGDKTLRVKFTLNAKIGAGPYVYGRIYVQGVAVGTQRTTNSITPTEYSEDITGISAGESVQIYAYTADAGEPAVVTNFRVCGTHIDPVDEVSGSISTP